MNRDARQVLTECLVLKAQDGDERAFTELYELWYELGFSTAEIAEVLEVPAGTIKSRLFRIRESLKHKIERMKS